MATLITLGDSDQLQIRIPLNGQTSWGTQFITEFLNRLVEHDHSGVDGRGAPISGAGLAFDSIAGDQFRLLNEQFLRARNSTDSGDVNLIRANSSDEIEFGAPLGNLTIVEATIDTFISTIVTSTDMITNTIAYSISTPTSEAITAVNDAVTNSTVVVCSTTEVATVNYKVTRGTTVQAGILECNGSTQDISDEFVGPDSGVTFTLSTTNELIVTTTNNVDDAIITYTIDRR